MLDEVRGAGLGLGLVPGAGADPEAEGDRADTRDPFRDDSLARVELGEDVFLHRRIIPAGRDGRLARVTTGLPDAERIPVGISQDRESEARALLRLDHRCAHLLEPLDLLLPIVGAEVQVDRIARGLRLLPPLKEKPRSAAVRRPGDVEAAELPLVDTCVTQLLHKALVGLLLGPAERLRPERAELRRFRARERDVADVAMRRRFRW